MISYNFTEKHAEAMCDFEEFDDLLCGYHRLIYAMNITNSWYNNEGGEILYERATKQMADAISQMSGRGKFFLSYFDNFNIPTPTIIPRFKDLSLVLVPTPELYELNKTIGLLDAHNILFDEFKSVRQIRADIQLCFKLFHDIENLDKVNAVTVELSGITKE